MINSIQSKFNLGKLIDGIFTSLLILFACLFVYRYLENAHILKYICPCILILNFFRILFVDQFHKTIDFIIDYRWIIGLILFIFLVIFRIHGSSIGCYDQIFGNDSSLKSELFGTGRPIRGDEWNVQVAYYFSQFYNGYSEISHQMSIAGQDMIIGYNAPVLGLTLVGKPFVWGYILFGNEVGLSWYWCSKTILCILVCYEMFYILTRNKYISLFGSFLLVFSPMMQWWFSPHMYDVMFWGMSLFDVGYYFFMSQSVKKKWAFTFLSGFTLIGFIIALFPSLQIPIGLLMLALLIACILRDKNGFAFAKQDVFRIITVIIIVTIVLGSFVWFAKDEIKLLYSTVYPGKRVCLGGNYSFKDLFTNINMIFTPIKSPSQLNACEISTFNHVGILALLLFPYLLYVKARFKLKSVDLKVGYILFVALILEILFMLFEFPEFFAKITLLSYVNRMNIVYGFTATIFTIWIINQYLTIKSYCSIKVLLTILGVFLLLNVLVVNPMLDEAYDFVPKVVFYFLGCIFSIIVLFVFLKKNHFAIAISCVWIFFTGCTINPIVKGISSITNHEFVKVAKSYSENDKEYWLTTESLQTQNLLLANGLKVINAVNFYPDYGKWKILDTNKEYDDSYNRYAHILVTLTSDVKDIEISLSAPDSIVVKLNVNELKKLNIRHICSMQDYSQLFEKENIDYKELYCKNNIYLYEVF